MEMSQAVMDTSAVVPAFNLSSPPRAPAVVATAEGNAIGNSSFAAVGLPPPPNPPIINAAEGNVCAAGTESKVVEAAAAAAQPEVKVPNYQNPIHKTNWKLFKAKMVLLYHLCGDCHERLFYSQDKIVQSGDDNHWIIKFELCHVCVTKNIHATTCLSKPYIPRQQQQQQPQMLSQPEEPQIQ